MQKTINAKWSEITGNRKELDETIIGKGIEEQSLVNSDELNSIVNRQDEMLDDLQRGNAWNIGKEYNQGDMVFVNVNYKRLSDSVGKTYKCFVICKQEKVKAEPFINKANKAIAFSKNYDYAVTQFIIQVDDDSTALTHFINDDFWDFVRLDNDLRNATKLNVSNEAKLGTQGKDSSIITFDRDIILNSNLDTKGTFDIKGNLTGGSLNSNNNIAWGSAFVKTPAYNAKGDEIVNAEWCKINTDYIEFLTSDKFNPIYIVDDINSVNLEKQPTFGFNDLNIQHINKKLLIICKDIPQDFDIEYFNSIKVNFYIYRRYEGAYNNLYNIITAITRFGACIKKSPYNIAMYSYEYNHKGSGYDNGESTVVGGIPIVNVLENFGYIKVDFNKSFELDTGDYFGDKKICGIISSSYRANRIWATRSNGYMTKDYYYEYHRGSFCSNILRNNIIEKQDTFIIKWDKENRKLYCISNHLSPDRDYYHKTFSGFIRLRLA